MQNQCEKKPSVFKKSKVELILLLKIDQDPYWALLKRHLDDLI